MGWPRSADLASIRPRVSAQGWGRLGQQNNRGRASLEKVSRTTRLYDSMKSARGGHVFNNHIECSPVPRFLQDVCFLGITAASCRTRTYQGRPEHQSHETGESSWGNMTASARKSASHRSGALWEFYLPLCLGPCVRISDPVFEIAHARR